MEFQKLQSYACLLNSLNTQNCIRQEKQLHILFLKKGVLLSTVTIANRLLQMYLRYGSITNARIPFDEMPKRNCFTWNTLLDGYAKSGHKTDMQNLFYLMPHKNEFSWKVILLGLTRAGELDVAQRLFIEDEWSCMEHHDSHICEKWEIKMALVLLKDFLKWEMIESAGTYRWDPFVLATVVGTCSEFGGLDLWKQVHARMIVEGVEFDTILGSSLVNMYGKCGDLDSAGGLLNAMEDPDNYSLSSLISGYTNCCRMDDARRIFELKYKPCVVLWNSMISGYAANGDTVEALIYFDSMHKQVVVRDYSTFASVLSACSSIGILRNCIQLHANACKLGILYDLVISGALIDAYAQVWESC